MSVQKNGANDRIRTDDLRITNALLYRLSYASTYLINVYILLGKRGFVNINLTKMKKEENYIYLFNKKCKKIL